MNDSYRKLIILAQNGNARDFFEMYKRKYKKYQLSYDTPLLCAAMANHKPEERFEIVNFLIKKGYDINCCNDELHSLLHILFSRPVHNLEQTVELTKKLLDLGIDVNRQDYRGRTAIHFMMEMGFDDAELQPLYNVIFSINRINLKLVDKWQHTPIDLAKTYGERRMKLLERMIEYDKKRIR